ncbi:MAG: efflux RND transporter permease subunit [Victivallaceae bacterium]|nr:efflux RND transporter permease subunit [Victivallaceae bacterium]
MFAEFFIRRPKFAFVISIVTVLVGAICLFRLPIAEYPEIAPPTVKVTAMYPGATSQVIAETVASVIEEQVNGIEDLLYFKSESDNNGNYTLTLTFEPGINSDIAQVNVQNAVQRADAQLPDTVRQIGVVTRKQSTDIAGVYSFQTDGTSLSMLELANYVRMNIKDAFARLPGLGSVEILGERNYSMRVWLDPLKMSLLKLTPEMVAAKISSQNAPIAAGALGGEKSSPYLQYKLDAAGRLNTPEEFADIVIASAGNGEQIRLGDIARLELGAERYTDEGCFNGRSSIAMAIYRQDGANAVELVKNANRLLDELKKHFPKGVEAVHAYDPSSYIIENVKEISLTLIMTLLLVIGITYIFLQDWRATVVPALAIPVSLLGTFFFMAVLGYSINVLTMFGLILVIGSLVDDAIVVVENTMRLIEDENLSPREAAVKSMGQVTGPVVAATLVSTAIYAPIGFYGGIVGTIYIQFAVTMCIALILSAFNALTLSPALCALILRPAGGVKRRKFVMFRWFDRALNSTKKSYIFFSMFMVRRFYLTIAIILAVLAANFCLFERLRGGFLPDEDKGSLLCEIELPPGAALTRTETAMARFSDKCLPIPGVKDVITVSGYSLMSGSGENLGFAIIALDDWNLRKSPALSIAALRDKVMAAGAENPFGIVRVFQPPAIMGLGVTGGVTFAFRTTGGDTPQQFERQLGRLLGMLNDKRQMPEVMYAFSSFNARTPQMFIDTDRQKAEALGVPVSRIAMALQSNLASLYINDFNINGYSFKVKIQLDGADRSGLNAFDELTVQNDRGEMVPLNAVATLRPMLGARKIERFNQNLSAAVTVIPAPGASTSQVMTEIEQLVESGFASEYAVSWTDMSYQERNNDGRILLLMTLAVIFGYLFLVAQYESWTIPMPVILSVAFASLGGAAALYFTGMLLDIYAQLGLIMLIGLCAKSTILMVEFSMRERQAGKSIARSAVNGANYRYRAVLMTAWSFIIGVLPLLFASGAGAESRRVIGTTTFWGMLTATIVGVAFIPPMFAVFQKTRERMKSRCGSNAGQL